jgi:D-alanyl-D-alanine carboxypeptidase (penicillin-binding protein 5/6)
MGLIACNLLKNYEDKVIPYSSMYESYIRTDSPNPFWLVNTNKMLKLNNGIDGLKTGWTTDAGYCITTTMKKDGMRLVCVVMGSDDPKLRNADAMNVLNYGFNTYDLLVLKEKGEIVDATHDILMDLDSYNVVLRDKLCVIKEKSNSYDNITYEIKLYKDKLRNLEYENIGIIKAYKDGKVICESILDLESIPKKSNFFEVLYKIFKSLF